MDWFKAAGKFTSSLGGVSPLQWGEIWAFGQAVGGLERWEMILLRQMSEGFVREYNNSADRLTTPPWGPEDDEEFDG